MNKPLSNKFFNSDTRQVAEDLIGCYLVRKIGERVERYMITETEACDGPEDLACHASKGKTRRTEIMFGKAGYIYIYLIYGMYFMLNIVTGPKDYPAAVLIRGVEGIDGPGKLTKKLEIDKSLNGKLLSKECGLWVEARDKDFNAKIYTTPRIGVDYAGPIWSKVHYRFLLSTDKQIQL